MKASVSYQCSSISCCRLSGTGRPVEGGECPSRREFGRPHSGLLLQHRHLVRASRLRAARGWYGHCAGSADRCAKMDGESRFQALGASALSSYKMLGISDDWVSDRPSNHQTQSGEGRTRPTTDLHSCATKGLRGKAEDDRWRFLHSHDPLLPRRHSVNPL